MKKMIFYLFLILNLMLLSSCTSYGPFAISHHYGDFINYNDGRHAGLDFNIFVNTPIIAATEGVASYPWIPCPDKWYCGGIWVELHHGQFRTLYAHLSKVYIEAGQVVKRGQLVGLSGKSNSGYPHLHFAVMKLEGAGDYFFSTYDPAEFWLGGKPQCFDPNKDYTTHSVRDITLPVACGEYAKKLKNEARLTHSKQ